jgi:hypothetical protein
MVNKIAHNRSTMNTLNTAYDKLDSTAESWKNLARAALNVDSDELGYNQMGTDIYSLISLLSPDEAALLAKAYTDEIDIHIGLDMLSVSSSFQKLLTSFAYVLEPQLILSLLPIFNGPMAWRELVAAVNEVGFSGRSAEVVGLMSKLITRLTPPHDIDALNLPTDKQSIWRELVATVDNTPIQENANTYVVALIVKLTTKTHH